MADQLQASNSGAQFPTITSIAGCGLFCAGQSTSPASVPASGPVQLNGILNNAARTHAMQQLLQFDNGLQLVQAANGILTRGPGYANRRTTLIATAKINTVFPAGNPLADQLLMVAKMISLRSRLGLTRQIFFCTLGGFDTHAIRLWQRSTRRPRNCRSIRW